jgi:hypothetical protein
MESENRMQGNLTQIRGIGEARSRWLQESLGIHSVQDLASQSIDQIQEKLKAASYGVARSEIEAWIAQAQRMVVKNLQPEVPDSLLTTGQQEPEWKTIAQFFVDFQVRQSNGSIQERRTKVHYMKDGREAIWPEFEGQRSGQWMLEQLEVYQPMISTSTRPPETTAEPAVVEAPAQSRHAKSGMPLLSIKISEVWLSAKAAHGPTITFLEPQKLPSAPLNGNTPFTIAISFTLTEPPPVEQAGTPVAYQAQFYAYNKTTGAQIHLGDSPLQWLLAGESLYTSRVQDASLPPGIYRLQTLMILQTSPRTIEFLEVPLLQVL